MPLRSLAVRLAALLFLALSAAPAGAGEFTDSAGRIVVLPDHINRVMAADKSAEVLIYALAPAKLLGWVEPVPGVRLPKPVTHLPVLGPIDTPMGAAAAARLRPDVIIDVSPVTPERAALADQIQQTTGAPYIVLDGSLARTPRMLRVVGRLLDVADRGEDLAGSAEHAINALRGRLLIEPGTGRPRVYYGRGPTGMSTVTPGTRVAESIENAGAINVAAALDPAQGAVATRQQLLEWNPDVIIAQRESFYRALLRDASWRGLKAVRDKHVYLEPSMPFGWIDDPPGVNRLIGLYWLSVILYPAEAQDDVRQLAQDLADKFYGIKLSDAEIAAIAKTAGIPESDTPHLADLPLSGTGIPPSVTPPGRGVPAPEVPTTPSYQMPR
jgi:iron complex transport system substrate-binding protein